MLDLDTVVYYNLVALLSVLALFWAERGVVNEFAYPIDPWPQGYATIVGVYVVIAWLAGLAPAVSHVTPENAANVTATLSIGGLTVVGVLRLYALARSFNVPPAPAPALSEIALLSIALGFGGSILIAGVGGLADHVLRVAPNSSGWNPQPESLLLIVGAIAFSLIVETVWRLWTLSYPHVQMVNDMAESAATEILRTRDPLTIRIALRLCKQPRVHTVKSLLSSFGGPDGDATVKESVDVLLAHGVVVPVLAGGLRRNPHFYKQLVTRLENRQATELEKLSAAEVQQVLKTWAHPEKTYVPPVLQPFIRGSDEEKQVRLREVVNDILSADPIDLSRQEQIAVQYLQLRYVEGRSVAETAKRVGYSREHLTRAFLTQSLLYLRRRIIEVLSKTTSGN